MTKSGNFILFLYAMLFIMPKERFSFTTSMYESLNDAAMNSSKRLYVHKTVFHRFYHGYAIKAGKSFAQRPGARFHGDLIRFEGALWPLMCSFYYL